MEAHSTSRGFQQHIHVFRGIAIIFIVFAHTIPSLMWPDGVWLGRVLDALFNQSSILFFFIAGYMFQYLSNRYVYSGYLKNKFYNVILPYLILSVPALVIFTVVVERDGVWSWFYEREIWEQVTLFLLTGKHLAPLWFVPTIAIFYLFSPLLIWIDRKRPQLYWLIIPLLLLSAYLGRDGQYGPIDKAIYLLPPYLLGMVCARHVDEAIMLIRRWWPVLAAVAIVCWVLVALGWGLPPYWQILFKSSLALLLLLVLLDWHHVFGRRLDYIAHVSFGIFFVHGYVIAAIKVLTVYLTAGEFYDGRDYDAAVPWILSGNVVSLLLYGVVVLLISLAIIWSIQRVLGKRSRMVIGS